MFINQQKRCDEIKQQTYDFFKPYVSDDGVIVNSKHWGLTHCVDLMGVFIDLGTEYERNMLEKSMKQHPDYEGKRSGFVCAHISIFLYNYGSKIDKSLFDWLNAYLLKHENYLYFQHCDYIGVNDNFPSWDIVTAYYTYRMEGKKELYELALSRLEDFKARLKRTTDSSEYNSPTYLPLTMLCMSYITNDALDNEKIKEVSNFCLQRLIKTSLMRVHKELGGAIGGPFGRAYTVDSVGAIHQMNYIFYMLLGDKVMPSLKNTVFNKEFFEGGDIIHGNMSYYVSNCYTFTRCPINLDKSTIDEFTNAKYPYIWTGTAEVSSSADSQIVLPSNDHTTHSNSVYYTDNIFEYPAGLANLYTYMGKKYIMATADKEFHNGIQSDSFMYIGIADNGHQANIFTKMITNDKEPSKSSQALLSDEGRKLAIQDENTAICTYHLKDVGNEVAYYTTVTAPIALNPLNKIKLSIIIYNAFNVVDEIEIINNKAFIRIGSQYLMFAPIREEIIKDVDYAIVNDFLMINFNNVINYDQNSFRRGRMLNLNGFVCEVRDVCDYVSINDFADNIVKFKLTDELYANMHTRMTSIRKTKFENDRVHIEVAQSVISEGIFYKEIYKLKN